MLRFYVLSRQFQTYCRGVAPYSRSPAACSSEPCECKSGFVKAGVVLYFAYDEQRCVLPVSCEARQRNDALCFSYWLGHDCR